MNRGEILQRLAAELADQGASFSPNVHVALKIRTALADPDCHAEEATRLVQAEPLLAARAVAMANSVAYNRSGREIVDVRSAVSRLGFSVLRNLATALVVRQMAQMPARPLERELATRLWEYTAHMAALARLIAREATQQDPEAAVFAAIVHDLGSFYLLARAKDFPGLLEGLDDSDSDGEIELTRTMLRVIAVPESIVSGIEAFWQGELGDPSPTLGDTLLLAAHLSPMPRPLHPLAGHHNSDLSARLDKVVGGETQRTLLTEAHDEVRTLRDIITDAQEELSAMLAVMQY